MDIPKPLYRKGEIVEILPYEDCNTSYGPGYVYEMIETFSENPKVEILYKELFDYQPIGLDKIYYYQYRVMDCNGEKRYVNENWIRPKDTTALFI